MHSAEHKEENTLTKRPDFPKDATPKQNTSYKLLLRKELKNVQNFGKFFFELDVLTIAGVSRCLKDGNNFESVKRFVKERLERYQFDANEIHLIIDYLNADNFSFKLMVNEGIERIEKDRFIIEAFVKCYIARYFANRLFEGKKGLMKEIEKDFSEMCGQENLYFFGELKKWIISYDIWPKTAQQYAEIASSFKDEIEDVYSKVFSEVQKRRLIKIGKKKDHQEESQNIAEKAVKSQAEAVAGTRENEEFRKLKEKLENYELMVNMLQEQIEELREINSELQKEREMLLQERQQLPEKILIKLFNDLNSPQFGNLLDKIYVYANDLEPVDSSTAQEIFTNIISVLSLYNIVGHLSKEEYKSTISIKKEEIGSIYRCDRPAQSDKQVYEAQILYPKWTYNQKTVANKFVRIKS
ncbi:hypothetical protein [Caldicellulosiruptor acetigenus]|uniref:Uncharacterized protein n=1 Tax=Caldicellulosiruptor acetigenus 6A TaxID=632516 RepID=G2PYJ7_9FIRM|nr:hypothetical protein [Caldicellulosiruptor acetigenus]AEM74916.1 hypothetical protein Calla_2389 [Caldicellulosiruptor acetigenus 6A]